MSNPKKLKKGDKVAIVSLSSGILGENFINHEIVLGEKRLKEFGLEPVYMPNAKKGLKFLSEHPEARAADLKAAFADESIKAIFCAIGGNDTYRTIPYLMTDAEFVSLVKSKPKIFMGFSDTTVNHLTLYKLGLNTFYGPAFLVDFAELDTDMLPYTKNAVNYLFEPTKNHKIESSKIWYNDRTDFSEAAVGTPRISHEEHRGFDLVQGHGKVSGKLLGGCIDSLGLLLGLRETEDVDAKDAKQISDKYKIFPTADEWANKIMFFETSESKPSPEFLRKIIHKMKELGVFAKLSGIVIGKPDDETYYSEYREIFVQEFVEYDFPVLYNLNFGHASPRFVLPFGTLAEIDADNKTFTLLDTTLD